MLSELSVTRIHGASPHRSDSRLFHIHSLKRLAAEKMSAETQDSSQSPPEKKSNTTLLILLVILALGVAGLMYDRRVARPGVEKAYDDLISLVEKTNRNVQESVNPEDVRAVVGRAPVSNFDDGEDFVEVFAWRSGLPIRTHKLYAVYKEQHGQKVFYRHAKFKYDMQADVIEIPKAIVIEGDPDDPDNGDPSADGGDDAMPGGAVAQGGAGPGGGGRNFDPEARFTESDEDGDGLLKGDEINPRMQENLSETDTDGDGAVSKEEFMARMEEVAARFQGGGAGGGGSAGGDGGATDSQGYSTRPPGAPIIQRGEGGEEESADADAEPESEDSESEDSEPEDSEPEEDATGDQS